MHKSFYRFCSTQAQIIKFIFQDFLGRLECTLGEIVGCGSGKLERKLVYVINTVEQIRRVFGDN